MNIYRMRPLFGKLRGDFSAAPTHFCEAVFPSTRDIFIEGGVREKNAGFPGGGFPWAASLEPVLWSRFSGAGPKPHSQPTGPQLNGDFPMNSHFFVLVDRGNVRAYRVLDAPRMLESPPSVQVQLVQAVTLVETHRTSAQKFTDDPGAFPVTDRGGPSTRHQNSMAERHEEIEEDRRLVKQLAGHINAILRQEQPGWWSFAATGDLHDAVLKHVEPQHREMLAETLRRDLVKVPPQMLMEHFGGVTH
jgi:hypothetical protein